MTQKETPINQRTAAYAAWLERALDRLERSKAAARAELGQVTSEREALGARKAEVSADLDALSDPRLIFERIRYCSSLDRKISHIEIQEMEIWERIRQIEGESRQFATRKKILERWLARQNARYWHRQTLREERRHQELAVLSHFPTAWSVGKEEGL